MFPLSLSHNLPMFNKNNFRRQLIIFMIALFLQGCFSSGEKKAHEEVLSTLSIEKLAAFFKKYPASKYDDLLIKEFSNRCDADPDRKSCYRMILEAIPSTNSNYAEINQKFNDME